MTSEWPPGVKDGVVGIRSLLATLGLKARDMGVFTDIKLVDGFEYTPCTSSFPSFLGRAEAQAIDLPYPPCLYDL